jgi:hypothetical protein
MALVHIVLGLVEHIRDVFQGSALAEVLDREDAPEYGLESGVLPRFGRDLLLQKAPVGILLNIYQVGDIDDVLDLGEVLSRSNKP